MQSFQALKMKKREWFQRIKIVIFTI